MTTLYTATLDRINEADQGGPYFWLSHDGETYLEVAELPAPEDRVSAVDQVTSEATKTGPGKYHLRIARRFLDHAGAAFAEVEAD